MFAVFERIGYQVSLEEVPDWDVLWMHDYPFTVFKDKMLNLKPHQKVGVAFTPCSKRKYTLCFPVSTQNVAGDGPLAVLRDSQSEFPNNQARVREEIPNRSKVLRESLLGCCVRKLTKIVFCH